MWVSALQGEEIVDIQEMEILEDERTFPSMEKHKTDGHGPTNMPDHSSEVSWLDEEGSDGFDSDEFEAILLEMESLDLGEDSLDVKPQNSGLKPGFLLQSNPPPQVPGELSKREETVRRQTLKLTPPIIGDVVERRAEGDGSGSVVSVGQGHLRAAADSRGAEKPLETRKSRFKERLRVT